MPAVNARLRNGRLSGQAFVAPNRMVTAPAERRTMDVLKIAAFSAGTRGGNPAGVVIAEALPSNEEMQRVAALVGFSETVFAAASGQGWRVRYFSPQAEIPFCGHATIALGAALAARSGAGVFQLKLNHTAITVEGYPQGEAWAAALQSPPTRSQAASEDTIARALGLFGYRPDDLDPRLPPALIHAGADHLLIALRERDQLAAMAYDFAKGQAFMRQMGVVTVMLLHAQTHQVFHVRNAFAFGGVYEDPATGAAAAALGGYLRDRAWPHEGEIRILQGDDMGVPCRIRVEISAHAAASVRVSGATRVMPA